MRSRCPQPPPKSGPPPGLPRTDGGRTMYATNYHRASSLADAASRRAGSDEAKYLAGGMTLIPTMKQRLAAPSDLVDLRHVAELKGISVEGKRVRIGAGTT